MERKTATGYRLIFGYLGIFLIIIGIIMLLPLIIIPFLPLFGADQFAKNAQYWYAFVIPGGGAIVVGLILYFSLVFRHKKSQLGKHQDSLLLVSLWLCATLIGSVPFMFRGFDFTQAVFESTSGFSSTGLTVFTSVELNPSWDGYYIFVLYRSLLLFFGGIGLVLIVASAISDRYGMNLYLAEGHNDRLMPNLARSARLILSIYTGYIILGIIAYVICGMPVFDAINHSIAALSTGGFSPHAENIAYYEMNGIGNGISIEIVSMFLMILGSTNFVTHLHLFKLKFKKIFKDCEIRFFGILCIVFIPLLTVSILLNYTVNGLDFWTSLRYGSFQFVSAVTTTGFSNTPASFAATFATHSFLILTIIMFIGGGLGSTSGSVKQYRIIISFKAIYWNIKKRLSSTRLVTPHFVNRLGEEHDVSQSETQEAFGIAGIYLCTLLAGALLICFVDNSVPLDFSLFEFMSALSGTGLTAVDFVGASAVNYGVIWILCVAMFIGRLEIIPVYFAGYRVVRDVLRKETV
jgi:trk system potassium uptake protein TrkH